MASSRPPRPPGKHGGATSTALHAATGILGLVLVFSPLALWVAWSEQVLLLVLSGGIAAIIALALIYRLSGDERDDAVAASGGRPASLSDEFIAEVSSMAPWIYHNRLSGDSRFQAKMRRLRKLLGWN